MTLRVLSLVLVLGCGALLLGQANDVVTPKADVTTAVIVRATASGSAPTVGTLKPGEQAALLGAVPNWYHVRLTNGTDGFVSKRWTNVSSGAPVGPPAAGTPTAGFTVDVVDVGTGLGVLVRGSDFTLVYDAGSNDDIARGPANRMLAFIRTAAPDLTTIDDVVLSHPHRDHVELLADVVSQFHVKQVWDSGRLNDICGYRAFVSAVRDDAGVQYHTPMQDGGTRDYAFGAGTCYGQQLPAQTVSVPHSTRISTDVGIPLGHGATMTILRADGANYANINDNSLAVRLDLGQTRILLVGDSEAGGRNPPTLAPTASSPEGILLACCKADLAADILIAGHHGSETSSRSAFIDAVAASIYVVSAGPTKYGSVVLPDKVITDELAGRGQLFRTDLNDATCGQSSTKIGPTADGQPGGCDNVRILIPSTGKPSADYWHGSLPGASSRPVSASRPWR